MRQFIRYMVDIPVEISVRDTGSHETEKLKNVSIAGLCITMSECPSRGSRLLVRIPYLNPPFQTDAEVVWCLDKGGSYDVGLCLLDPRDAFNVRMVEQVCYIEHYRKEVLRTQGRRLTRQQAAEEWIGAYSSGFPHIEAGRSHVRRFIRHPTDISVETLPVATSKVFVEDAHDIGLGGLRLSLPVCPEVGSEIKIRIQHVDPPFEATGKVAWCRSCNDFYDVGIQLDAWHDQAWVRVLEQVFEIEQYKRNIREETGRQLSTVQAAEELRERKRGEAPLD